MVRRGYDLARLRVTHGLNHIGHALLCRLLLPTLQAQPFASRVIAVSSVGHRFAVISPHDRQCTYLKFLGWGSYLSWKLASILYTKALHQELSGGWCGGGGGGSSSSNIIALSLSPGIVKTGIWSNTPPPLRSLVGWVCDRDVGRGAATAVYCSVAPCCADAAESGGSLWADCRCVCVCVCVCLCARACA